MSATAAKRKTKRAKYDVRWREGSKHRSRSFDRKQDADDFLAEVRRRQSGEAVVHPNETATMDAFANAWQKRRAEGGTLLGTRKANRSIYNKHVSPYLGHRHVGELRVKVLDDWRADLRSDGASIHTQRRATGLLAMILDDVVRREDGLTGNPARALPAIRGHERREGQAASPEQVEAIRAHFLTAKRPADAALISILAYVGLRPEEALALEPSSSSVTAASSTCATTRLRTGPPPGRRRSRTRSAPRSARSSSRCPRAPSASSSPLAANPGAIATIATGGAVTSSLPSRPPGFPTTSAPTTCATLAPR
jgi:hypothetical protein